MVKKCVMCGSKAELCIKGSSDYYCKDCAEDSFSDQSVLVKVEEQAQRLKGVIEDKIQGQDSEEDEDDDEPME